MRTIKPLSAAAAKVFSLLTQDMQKPGDHRKVADNPSFMAVCVELVDKTPQNAPIFSVAHYYEQNGDLMADPEVTFVRAREDYVYPITYRQDGLGMDREYVRWEGDKVFWNLAAQNDLASFCNQWMKNIKEQQWGGRLPKSVGAIEAG